VVLSWVLSELGGYGNLGFGIQYFWKENGILVNKDIRIIDVKVQGSRIQDSSYWGVVHVME